MYGSCYSCVFHIRTQSLNKSSFPPRNDIKSHRQWKPSLNKGLHFTSQVIVDPMARNIQKMLSKEIVVSPSNGYHYLHKG